MTCAFISIEASIAKSSVWRTRLLLRAMQISSAEEAALREVWRTRKRDILAPVMYVNLMEQRGASGSALVRVIEIVLVNIFVYLYIRPAKQQ